MAPTLLALSLAGCGTLANLAQSDKNGPDGRRPAQVYGGVGHDVNRAQECFSNSSDADAKSSTINTQLKGTGYLVDLPFSFVGDTVTLPLTLLSALGQEEDSLRMSSDRNGGGGGGSMSLYK